MSDTTTAQADDRPIPYTLAENAACTVYPWCIATGVHQDHYSKTVDIPAPSKFPNVDRPYLGVYLIDLGAGRVSAGLDAGTWLDVDSTQLHAEARKIRDHSVYMDALADQLAAIEAEQAGAPPQPEPVGARTWTLTVDGGGQITGRCPRWCENEHDTTHTAAKLSLHLVDFAHIADFDGVPLNVFLPADLTEDGKCGVHETEALRGHIIARPFSSDPDLRVPTANVEVIADLWMSDLGPDELAQVIAKLRAQCDRLDQVHTQLVQARTDWQVQA